MNYSHDVTDVIRKTTVTFSAPLQLAAWLKRTKKNVSVFVVEAVLEKRERDEQVEQAQETT